MLANIFNTTHTLKALVYCSVILLCSLLLAVPQVMGGQYKAGVGDVLRVTIYDNPDLDTVARVGGDGHISIPLIGPLKVIGFSPEKIATEIEKKLAAGYLNNPQATVFIEEYHSSKVSILGMIRNPGLYELSGPTTLLELISKAGGLMEEAGSKASIQRGGQESNVAVIDLDALLQKGDLTHNVQVKDKDSIFIARAGLCYVTGEVENPDSYAVERDSTVLKLITKAGGFTGIASKGGVKLIRVVDGEKKIFERVNLDTAVMADDIIVVPESFF